MAVDVSTAQLAVFVPAVNPIDAFASMPVGALQVPPMIELLSQKSITRLCAPVVAGVNVTL
jgi:hypothetical protein